MLVAIVFNGLNGIIMGKTGYYMPCFVIGNALLVIGAALMCTVDVSTSSAAIYGYSAIVAVGAGSFVQASFPAAQARVAASSTVAATTLISCAQFTGLAFSFAMGNSIFLNRTTRKIQQTLSDVSTVTVQSLVAGQGGGEKFTGLAPQEKEKVLQSIAEAISEVYYVVLAGSALAFLLSLSLRRSKTFVGK